ncbi:hypothetical protein EV189_2253 [Motilibacter rhizosphaerae]|uniref:Uncharacterized protein n=1 Tax=Motilibacter rhizosphaerae TaxID=598652 RepID=A0A4V2F496_9ACTN|nr:hypothetical protein [Motilibacter rhizosphaerae]RZS86837.1 hypothetical protein EV189_2253 [Motilibacter rhizosphaerae]
MPSEPPLPAPGTFALYPYAVPPVPAGSYLLTGATSGLPGPVEDLRTRVVVTGPRFALPPDQVLSTYPPARATGYFASRLPQVVLRRRTLPWERSPDLPVDGSVPGPDDPPPTPWLALVLVAEGEGQLRHDVPVAECVSADAVLPPGEADVARTSCLEVPLSVVQRTFPTREDLALLCSVRAVDLRDTELALGDDDGWLAVVLGNRLPQPGGHYLACLVNLEGQLDVLPTNPPLAHDDLYDRVISVVDVRADLQPEVAFDPAVMRLPSALREAEGALDIEEAAPGFAAPHTASGSTFVTAATGTAVPTGGGWASALESAGEPLGVSGLRAKMELGAAFAIPPRLFDEPKRFPVLAYWSFDCAGTGDFRTLASELHVRLLGHVVTGPETPDGDPVGPGSPAQAVASEPVSPRPLPLVAETGHVRLEAHGRRGETGQAWFRGPLAPAPVPRVEPDPDQPEGLPALPLTHHADQLRRVVPDGSEDLGYAAAFEIGRLLALAQPAVVGALSRWRQEAYGAARVRAVGGSTTSALPDRLRAAAEAVDPLTGTAASATLGARAARALVTVLGDAPEVIPGDPRPLADPGAAAGVLDGLLEGRTPLAAALAGVGLAELADVDGPDLLARLTAAGVQRAQVGEEGEQLALRSVLEREAGQVAQAAARGVQGVRRLDPADQGGPA